MGFSAVLGGLAAGAAGSLFSDDNGAEAANNAAADSTTLQAQIARDQWNKYKEIYEPLEKQMVAESQQYATPENYAKAAGEASATVSNQFGKARDRLTRTPGLDPSSAAYQSSLVGLDLAQAATDATAQNAARQGVTDTSYARKQAALGLGKGLDTTASAGLSRSAETSRMLGLAGQNQANLQAAGAGKIVSNIFNTPSVGNWINNKASGALGLGGAGSMTAGGSVQGNSDYYYL